MATSSGTLFGNAENLEGRRFAFFGRFGNWPQLHVHTRPAELVRERGALVVDQVDDQLDYLVIGDKPQKGRADAVRKAARLRTRGATIETLDEREFLYLIRPQISGRSFCFTGGFSAGGLDLEEGPGDLLAQHGASLEEKVNDDLDCLVVGERRGKGKTATLRRADELRQQGSDLIILPEHQFLELVACLSQPGATQNDFRSLAAQLRQVADERRVDRAIKMLKKEAFQLYANSTSETLGGIVKSQTQEGTFYASWIDHQGRYSCYDHDLEACRGTQGAVCKHILVLLIGMARNGGFDPACAYKWIRAAAKKKPVNDPNPSAELILPFRGVEAGEVDWRPTETVPEDYYAL